MVVKSAIAPTFVLAPTVFGKFCHKSINYHKKRYGDYNLYINYLTKIEVKHPQFEIPYNGPV